VTTRRTKRAEAVTVELHQGDRLLLTAQAWFIDAEHEGMEHDHAASPGAPHWSDCMTIEERVAKLPPNDFMPFRFWQNFEERPTMWTDNWEDREAGLPEFTNWLKFKPQPDVGNVAVDAARLIVLADTVSWPAATRAHKAPLYWMAPSLDLNVQFHRFRPDAEWLLMYGRADVSTQGLFAFNGQVWTDDNVLLASSSGQCFYRAMPVPD